MVNLLSFQGDVQGYCSLKCVVKFLIDMNHVARLHLKRPVIFRAEMLEKEKRQLIKNPLNSESGNNSSFLLLSLINGKQIGEVLPHVCNPLKTLFGELR